MRVPLSFFVAAPLLAACGSDVGSIPAPVDDLSARYQGAVFVTIDWTAPIDEEGNPPSTYDVRHSVEPILEETWEQAHRVPENPRPLPGGNAQELSIFGLEPLSEYHIALRSSSDEGTWSDLSNVLRVQTTASTGDYFPTALGMRWFYLIEQDGFQIYEVADDSGEFTQLDVIPSTSEIFSSFWVSKDSLGFTYYRSTAWRTEGCTDSEVYFPPVKFIDSDDSMGHSWDWTHGSVQICPCNSGCDSGGGSEKTFTVVAIEPISVPAGEFTTIKVLGGGGVHWFAQDVGLVKADRTLWGLGSPIQLTAFPGQSLGN